MKRVIFMGTKKNIGSISFCYRNNTICYYIKNIILQYRNSLDESYVFVPYGKNASKKTLLKKKSR